MIGYHISEHARQKILKEIAIRAQKHVLDMTYNLYGYSPPLSSPRLNCLTVGSGKHRSPSFQRSGHISRTSWEDLSPRNLTLANQYCSLPKRSPPHAKPWKSSHSSSFAQRISSPWYIRSSPNEDHRPAISTRRCSSVTGSLLPHPPCPAFLCRSGLHQRRSATPARSSARVPRQ